MKNLLLIISLMLFSLPALAGTYGMGGAGTRQFDQIGLDQLSIPQTQGGQVFWKSSGGFGISLTQFNSHLLWNQAGTPSQSDLSETYLNLFAMVPIDFLELGFGGGWGQAHLVDTTVQANYLPGRIGNNFFVLGINFDVARLQIAAHRTQGLVRGKNNTYPNLDLAGSFVTLSLGWDY